MHVSAVASEAAAVLKHVLQHPLIRLFAGVVQVRVAAVAASVTAVHSARIAYKAVNNKDSLHIKH